MSDLNRKAIENNTRQLLELIGENPNRPGLLDTPKRVAKSLDFLTGGERLTLADAVGDGIFDTRATGLVMQENIEFYSMCEHHMLPFFGHVDISYRPQGKILGLSKLGRIVDLFARRLQVQEHLTEQIAQAIQKVINPSYVSVKIKGQHMCMMMRGVQKQNTHTITFFEQNYKK